MPGAFNSQSCSGKKRAPAQLDVRLPGEAGELHGTLTLLLQECITASHSYRATLESSKSPHSLALLLCPPCSHPHTFIPLPSQSPLMLICTSSPLTPSPASFSDFHVAVHLFSPLSFYFSAHHTCPPRLVTGTPPTSLPPPSCASHSVEPFSVFFAFSLQSWISCLNTVLLEDLIAF